MTATTAPPAAPAADLPPTDAPPATVAAILDDGSIDADALLAALARAQAQRGRRVRGLLMTYPQGRGDCSCPMVLVDVATGESFKVSQDLGPGATGCRADPQGFARASRVLRDAQAGGTDLVISNRFGGLEAGGGGFVDELLAIMAAGVPLLTVVAPRHLAHWASFTGDAAVLPPDEAAISAWIDAALAPAAA